MLSVLATGSLWPSPLWIFLFVANFPVPSALLPFDNEGEVNTTQIALTIIPAGTLNSGQLITFILLIVIIIPFTFDFCWLIVALITRRWPARSPQKSPIPTTTPPVSQGGHQQETLILPGHRLDVEPTFPLVELVELIEPIQRYSQVGTIHEVNSPLTPRTFNSIPNPQTPPLNDNPYTIAEPVMGGLSTPSMVTTTPEVNDPHEPTDHNMIGHPFISSPTLSPSISLIDDDGPSRFSRYSSRTPGDERSLNSPADSTRPPTYHTRASQATISTLPLYQEDGDGRTSRASSRQSASTTRARRDRLASLPPLPLPSFSIQKL